MKLLLISDEESPYYWDYYRAGRLDGIDLILSAGDLKPEYLSFLVTMGHAPLLYVHGNHDGLYEHVPPEGCDCIDGELVTVKGLRILGLGGSGGPHQYTEKQMLRRIRKLRFRLRRSKGVDLVLTHAPVLGLGDLDDPVHRGFACFLELLDQYSPRYWVHGHVHPRYDSRRNGDLSRGETVIINACGYRILEIPDKPEERTLAPKSLACRF